MSQHSKDPLGLVGRSTIERKGITAHTNTNLDGRAVSTLLQLNGLETTSIRKGLVDRPTLHGVTMDVKDGLVDFVDIINDGPEEVTQKGRGTGVAKDNDGTVLLQTKVVQGLLGPLDTLLMTDVPLGLVGDGTIDKVEADEQHAVVQEGKVLLPAQLPGDGKAVGEVVLEAVEVLHPVVKGGVGVGTFVPVLIARQNEDRGPAGRLEDGAGTLVHGLGARGCGGQSDVAEVNDELGIVGEAGQIAQQLILLGIVVRDVASDVERHRFADVPVVGRGGAVGIGPTPVAKGGTIQRPDDGRQCHEDDSAHAKPLATLPADLLGDEVVARMEVVGWFGQAGAIAEVDPRRPPSPRRRGRFGRISRDLHLVLVGIVPGTGGRSGRTADALHVVGRGTEHARGAPTAGPAPAGRRGPCWHRHRHHYLWHHLGHHC